MNLKVLAIGNSFSQDATRYLHQIAKADDVDLKVVNLYIGGCSLSTHYQNMLEDKRAYSLEFNGEVTGFFVSIREALESDTWDVVTLQQVSQEAPRYDTYQPYLDELAAYVRRYRPESKLYIHQTWAYEENSARLCEELKYARPQEMLDDVKAAYAKAAEAISADGLIPSGELMETLLENGIPKVHRDTYHVLLGLGRYALGLLWYHKLMGRAVASNTFAEFDEPISSADIRIIKDIVDKIG